MAHKALYRTWRPERFGDVVGQDHIVKVLSGQISSSKTAHAYLFAGPRGTGKTSLAKIFAKAVNCTNRKGAEPCGMCAVCEATAADNAVDIVEIDAASNNGVDSVRDIRDRVNLLPAVCTHKVYIIDEVHMLSKGAFNALLKTLEEPPDHVIFILATTEPHKLPATILSRCQRFDFRRIPVAVIAERLVKVAEAEGYVYSPEALKMIARAAEGGMRDALSILDQCAAFGDINAENVADALGSGDREMLIALSEHIANYDEKGALESLLSILDAGADTRALIKDLADIFRRMMWLSTGADIEETDERLKPLAKLFGKNACIRALDILIQKEYEMRQNLRADIVLETALMAVMAPEDDATAGDTVRLEKLEARLSALESGHGAAQPKPAEKPGNSSVKAHRENTAKKAAQAKTQKTSVSDSGQKNMNTDNIDMADIWQKVLDGLKKDAYFVFTHAQKAKEVLQVGHTLEIKYDSSEEIAADYLKQPAAQKTIIAGVEKLTGKPLSVSVVIEKAHENTPVDTEILKMFGTDIEEI